jgi:TRAP-type C4-dicarboxylate transport system substrate-binding protein
MRPNPACAALFAVLAFSACAGGGSGDKAGGQRASKPTVLTLANGNGDPLALEPFADEVRKRSGGTLRIAFKNRWRDGQPDYEANLIHDVKAGKADLGWAGTRAFDDVGVPSFDALHAPLLIDSLALERQALESPIVPEMLGGLKPAGVVGLGMLPGPLRRPLGVTRLVRPQDYQGATVALQRSQVGAETLHALGAKGVNLAASAPVDGYDGVEQQISSIAGNGYDRVASHLAANVVLWPRPLVLFANPKALSGLDERQRRALTSAAPAVMGTALAYEKSDEAESTKILCRRGVKFDAARLADLQALRRAVQPVYDQLDRRAQTKAAIAKITAMRADLGEAADAPACPSQDSRVQAPARATPVDGVYRSDVTLEQLEHTRGYDSGEDNLGNVGRFKLELRNGRFRLSGASDHTRSDGTYSVEGNVLRFEWEAESHAYRWSLYRGALTLRKVAEGPTSFVVHPWRRVGAAASVGARTPLDGIYTLNYTRAEAAKVIDPGDLVSENWGRWRFVLDRGQMYYTQASEGNHRWTRARYTAKGDILEYTITDYGGEAPHGAAEKTGEVFTFRWSRYRDRLSLAPVKGKVSPANLNLKPWRRVGDAP